MKYIVYKTTSNPTWIRSRDNTVITKYVHDSVLPKFWVQPVGKYILEHNIEYDVKINKILSMHNAAGTERMPSTIYVAVVAEFSDEDIIQYKILHGEVPYMDRFYSDSYR